jgi:hypothetical protein
MIAWSAALTAAVMGLPPVTPGPGPARPIAADAVTRRVSVSSGGLVPQDTNRASGVFVWGPAH